MTFAHVFDAGPFRVRKCESAVLGLGASVEVFGTESKLVGFASLLLVDDQQ